MDFRRLLLEIKQRKVHRAAAIYSAGAWALLQVADVLVPLVNLPDSAIPIVLELAALGFIPSMILAWYFDITPKGVVEAPKIDYSPDRMSLTPARVAEFSLILFVTLFVGLLYASRLDAERTLEQIEQSSGISKRPSIAVMPFRNINGDIQLEYFGDGLAGEILNVLSGLSELNVTARSSSFYFKNKSIDIQIIGHHLGVSHVLEGSVSRQDSRIVVTTQLIEAISGFPVWSDTYDSDLTDILSLQHQISSDLVASLEIFLSPASRESIQRSYKVDPLAYDNYLRARAYLSHPMDDDNAQGAIDLFTAAVELDPGFAKGFAGLCDAWLSKYSLSRHAEHFEAAEKSCHRALTLNIQEIDVYVALGNLYRHSGHYNQANLEYIQALSINANSTEANIGLAQSYFQQGLINRADELYRRVIDLRPHDARGYLAFGHHLYSVGEVKEAIAHFKKSTELAPDSELAYNSLGSAYFMRGRFDLAAASWRHSLKIAPSAGVYSNIASSMFYLGEYDDAALWYSKALELSPENADVWGALGDSYRFSSQTAELALPTYARALELSQQRLRINPSDGDTFALIGHYYAASGDKESALANIEKAIELSPQSFSVHYAAAKALCSLGDPEEALGYIEKAIQYGYPRELLRADGSLRELTSNPRFEELAVRDG
ncbi:MAG: tetratricopeptide repeat protein [Halioglobus sp.]